MIEINNEDSVLLEWANRALDDLPDPYATEFRKQWNDWLKKKYKTTEELLKAWDCRNIPLGDEMIPGGDFSKAFEIDGNTWFFQLDDKDQATATVVPDEKLLRLTVHRDGKVSWTPQLMVRNLSIKKDAPYTLSFRVRGDRPVYVHTSVSMDVEPWRILGTSDHFQMAKEWKTYTYRFYGAEDFDKVRFNFTGLKVGTYEFADLTLRSGGEFGLDDDAKLETGTIPTLKMSDQHFSEEGRRDFWRFLVDIERAYWPEMARFLKEELHVKSPISGTQLYYGSKHVQAELDYCDDHAYWNHPSWPERAWDPTDWYIHNRSLVNWADTEIFTQLGTRRIAGKPHTISEYNHPMPNQYAAEGLPMLCAFSQFQGWNGIYQYTYSHQPHGEPDKFTGYFDMIQQVGQLVHAPACANIMLRGDVSPAKLTICGSMSPEAEIAALLKVRSPWPWQMGFESVGLDSRLALIHATALDVLGERGLTSPALMPTLKDDQKVFVSDTGELTWNMEHKGKGYFVLNTLKTKVFTGFVKDGFIDLGDGIGLAIGETRLGWATVTLTELAPKHRLLAASGYMENTGMKFVKYGLENDDRYTVNNNWGTGPVLCEGIKMTLVIPLTTGVSHVYALDVSGNRTEELGMNVSGANTIIGFGPYYKTLWYEIVTE